MFAQRIVAMVVVTLAVVACGGTAAVPSAGPTASPTTFTGDGYSLAVPASPAFVLTRGDKADMWLAETDEGHVAFSAMALRNLLSHELSIEGIRDRAVSAFERSGIDSPGSGPRFMAAGGSAWQVGPTKAANGDVWTSYAYYENGVGIILSTLNMPEEARESLARSVRFR